ncbi:MAG: UvrD-helicase domain-containing protein [Spirochaetales bacterium]|nr:UvrD-helicase domain-containing protein [Spirochaetales bacterium]
MKYCADLHIHSPFSRGTSRALSLAGLASWARIKGVDLLGTGDFTHPKWRAALREHLIPDGRGFFALRDEAVHPAAADFRADRVPIRFCLSAEISSIYRKNGATRKVHSLIFAPDLEKAEKISLKLAAIGNVASDGRPILGLDPKNLLEIVKDVSPECHFIPAHIWTPWFSVFGAHSGFDSLEECFDDLLPEIFALETGLSSDPPMNWRLSSLDRFTLVSNSDAHSGPKLMREATLFDTELSYKAMFRALKTREGFGGTIEFFPAEGKYHFDGHRKCGVVLSPEETRALRPADAGDGRDRCPVCGRPLTIGVMHRVLDLADRPAGEGPAGQQPFRYAIPLPEIISELAGVGPASRAVQERYRQAVAAAGSERAFLFDLPAEDIRRAADEWLALAVVRLRANKVVARPGYDGEFGVIRVFEPGELDRLRGQAELFSAADVPRGLHPRNQDLFREEAPATVREPPVVEAPTAVSDTGPDALNEEQRAVLAMTKGAALVLAGPGTGKTRTLLHWIVNLLTNQGVAPRSVCVFTFTHKAKGELVARLQALLGERAREVTVTTFHAFCYEVVVSWYPEVKSLYDETGRRSLLRFLYPALPRAEIEAISSRLERYLDGTDASPAPDMDGIAAAYQEALRSVRGVDVAGLVSSVNLMFERRPEILDLYRDRFQTIAVDEFQDINRTQYRFLAHLIGGGPGPEGARAARGKRVLVIGDPDQAIYGFRGGDASLFFRFQNDYRAAYASLSVNYRSPGPIVDAARALISHNSLKSGLRLASVRPEGPSLTVAGFADQDEEGERVAALIRSLVGGLDLHAEEIMAGGKSHSFGQIAVLARTHRAFEPVIRACLRHNIPAAFRTGRALLAEPAYALLAEALRYLMNREDVVAFQNLIAYFLPSLGREALTAVVAAFKEAKGDAAGIAGAETLTASLSGVERRSLEEVFRFLEFTDAEIEAQGMGKGILLLLEKIHGSRTLSEEERIADLALVEMASGYGNDSGRFIREVLLSPREAGFGFPVERVSFLTFHAAKGLEFPVVVIVAAEEGIAPQARADSDPEEERRLFYVALTRAGERAYVTYALRRDIYGKETVREPSRFIAEIPDELIEKSEAKPKKKVYTQPTLF